MESKKDVLKQSVEKEIVQILFLVWVGAKKITSDTYMHLAHMSIFRPK